jgi:hypothetical protein
MRESVFGDRYHAMISGHSNNVELDNLIYSTKQPLLKRKMMSDDGKQVWALLLHLSWISKVLRAQK